MEDAGEARAAFARIEGAIDYRRPKYVDAPLFASLQIDLAGRSRSEVLPFLAEQFAGKYVLIGGDIVDLRPGRNLV